VAAVTRDGLESSNSGRRDVPMPMAQTQGQARVREEHADEYGRFMARGCSDSAYISHGASVARGRRPIAAFHSSGADATPSGCGEGLG